MWIANFKKENIVQPDNSFIVPYGLFWLLLAAAFIVWLGRTVRRILNVFVWHSLVQLRIADIRLTIQHPDFVRLLFIARRFGTKEIKEYIDDLIKKEGPADSRDSMLP